MQIILDLPWTAEEILKEREEQRKEFIRMGLLPIESEDEENDD